VKKSNISIYYSYSKIDLIVIFSYRFVSLLLHAVYLREEVVAKVMFACQDFSAQPISLPPYSLYATASAIYHFLFFFCWL